MGEGGQAGTMHGLRHGPGGDLRGWKELRQGGGGHRHAAAGQPWRDRRADGGGEEAPARPYAASGWDDR